MAIDPKKNLDDIGFMIYELKDIYALTDDPEIDTILPDPLQPIEEVKTAVEMSETVPEYKKLKDYDGNIKIWLDKVIDLVHTGTGFNNFNYNEIFDANNEFLENSSKSEKDELDSIFSGNLDFNNPNDDDYKSPAFKMYEAYQLLKELDDNT